MRTQEIKINGVKTLARLPKSIKKMPKKINTDWDRVSKEKHEIAYVRKLAREVLRFDTHPTTIRLAKAFLKVTKGYARKK